MTSVMLVEIKSFLHKKPIVSSDRVIFEFSKYAEAEPAVKSAVAFATTQE
ncbi:hypothetical protein SAMN04489799_0565 [Pseudomonas azotoformans]|nr:hypothetical protein SAMN04489799_0565 [Pseudomonas azotoformans]